MVSAAITHAYTGAGTLRSPASVYRAPSQYAIDLMADLIRATSPNASAQQVQAELSGIDKEHVFVAHGVEGFLFRHLPGLQGHGQMKLVFEPRYGQPHSHTQKRQSGDFTNVLTMMPISLSGSAWESAGVADAGRMMDDLKVGGAIIRESFRKRPWHRYM